jgi:hypothetical protein
MAQWELCQKQKYPEFDEIWWDVIFHLMITFLFWGKSKFIFTKTQIDCFGMCAKKSNLIKMQ